MYALRPAITKHTRTCFFIAQNKKQQPAVLKNLDCENFSAMRRTDHCYFRVERERDGVFSVHFYVLISDVNMLTLVKSSCCYCKLMSTITVVRSSHESMNYFSFIGTDYFGI